MRAKEQKNKAHIDVVLVLIVPGDFISAKAHASFIKSLYGTLISNLKQKPYLRIC